jgi:hypothetical protein
MRKRSHDEQTQGVSIRQRHVSDELRILREKTSLPFLNLCGLRRILRHELLALVRDGEERNWHEMHGRLPTNWKHLISFENVATAIYNYEPMAIPGEPDF